MKEEIRRLQNHFNAGKKDGFQAKVYYSVNDRVHLKGTNVNGIITGVIFKEDRSYPYLKINGTMFLLSLKDVKHFMTLLTL